MLLGAAGVAIGNVLLKRLTGQVDLLMATGWQFVLGGMPLLVVGLIFETPLQVVWSPSFVAVLFVLGRQERHCLWRCGSLCCIRAT